MYSNPDGDYAKSKTVIHTVSDLLDASAEAEEHFGRRPWFRGHRDGAWHLIPVIRRFAEERGIQEHQGAVLSYERTLLRKFIARARLRHKECPAQDDHFAWLSLARHYGLPTRLLDWTESILVAAYFAVSGKNEANPPAIWALDPYRLNRESIAPAVRSSFSLGMGGPTDQWHPLVARLASQASRNVSGPEGMPKPGGERQILAVISRETDLRMLVQHATFTIHGEASSFMELPRLGHMLLKFDLSVQAKNDLPRQLELLNARRETFFPDLDRLAAGIAAGEPAPQTSIDHDR